MASRLTGLTEVYSLFANIPDAAKTDLKGRLERIGEAAMLLQEQAAPKKTGNLASTITVSEQVQNLRVKAGLTKILKGNKSTRGNFYGIFVEYGRHAGAKLVQRRQRVDGKLRLGRGRRKRDEDIKTSYLMRWDATPAHPFIHIETRLQAIVDGIMAGFWDSVIT